MKYKLNLSLWFLLATIAMPLTWPITTSAKTEENNKEKRKGLKKKFKEAKALYEKRKKEGAPKAELAKLETEMKKARRRYIGAIVGISAAVAAATAATAAAAYAASKETPEQIPTTTTTTEPTPTTTPSEKTAWQEGVPTTTTSTTPPVKQKTLAQLFSENEQSFKEEFVNRGSTLTNEELKRIFNLVFVYYDPAILNFIYTYASEGGKNMIKSLYSIANMVRIWDEAGVEIDKIKKMASHMQQTWKVPVKPDDGLFLRNITLNDFAELSKRRAYIIILLNAGVRDEESRSTGLDDKELADIFRQHYRDIR